MHKEYFELPAQTAQIISQTKERLGTNRMGVTGKGAYGRGAKPILNEETIKIGEWEYSVKDGSYSLNSKL